MRRTPASRILVTGASGFIGQALTATLSREVGCETHAVVRRATGAARQGVREIVADLAEPGWTAALPETADVVVHLAQSSHYREFPAAVGDIVGVNVDASVELADWGRRAGIRRFLYASTGNVYGSRVGESREDDSPNPRGMYAVSKHCAELLLGPYAEFFEVVVMRLFGVYGPGQRGMTISRLIDQVLASEEIALSGGAGLRLNPIYVDDCVAVMRGLKEIGLSRRYEVINIGGAETVDLPEIARVIGNIAGRRPRTRATEGEPVNLVGSIAKLARLMPGRGVVSLEEGLRRIIAAKGAQA